MSRNRQMNFLYRISLLMLLLTLNGCSSSLNSIHKEINPYRYQPNTAVIVLGTVGEAKLISLEMSQNNKIQIYNTHEKLQSAIKAFAWKVPVGETYRIKSVHMSSQISSSILLKHFVKSQTLNIKTEGIYYYGTLLNQGENIVLINKLLPDIISHANKKYPYTFNILKPINFK